MNPDIKARWLEKLRSGKYAQGKSALRVDDKYCCLGVLCEVAVEDGLLTHYIESGTVTGYESGKNENGLEIVDISLLPRSIVAWAGLDDENPEVQTGWEDGEFQSLSFMNDSGDTFTTIADLIEAGL